jgi:hypothetical protein
MSLYRRMLRDKWKSLPHALQVMHAPAGLHSARGLAEVTRGTSLLARVAGALFGFPEAGKDVPLQVNFAPTHGTERWTRRFNGQPFSSLQFEGAGRYAGLLCERFGPLTFGLDLVVDGGSLHFVIRRWDILGFPLPLRLAPLSTSRELEQDGRFWFDVQISHPNP